MHFNGSTITFLVISIVIILCAIMTFSVNRVIYMALSLGGVFVGCAAVYMLLGAEFVGVAQILIYVGAITILIMFAIMLTNHEAVELPLRWGPRHVLSAVGCVLLAALLYLVIRKQVWPNESAAPAALPKDNTVAIGVELYQHFAIPFELVSLLLIVGLVGAVILAQPRKEDE
jgi:NADH-quinone oxidoreductase subunit J